MPKPLTVWITINCGKFWKRIPDHMTCLLRNLYAGQEATVRTGHGTTDWFQIRKGVRQGLDCHPAYLTDMQSTSWETLGWNEAQAGMKIAGRNINKLRYSDDTTLKAESEELKSPLMKMKEKSEKVGLKLNIQKTKIMVSGPMTSWDWMPWSSFFECWALSQLFHSLSPSSRGF